MFLERSAYEFGVGRIVLGKKNLENFSMHTSFTAPTSRGRHPFPATDLCGSLQRSSLVCGPRATCCAYAYPDRLNAFWTVEIRAFAWNGLLRKSTAPASIADRRLVASSCAVTKMIGTATFDAFRRRCSSSPSIPGIRTSRIMHSVCETAPEYKNCSADSNVATWCPADRKSALVESRIDSSSSTIEIMLHSFVWYRYPQLSQQLQVETKKSSRSYWETAKARPCCLNPFVSLTDMIASRDRIHGSSRYQICIWIGFRQFVLRPKPIVFG